MTMPMFTMRQLLENGVHYGHTTRRWNPKMKPFLFGTRSGIHIINLDETYPMLNHALQKLRDTAASGGRILFVGTKRQARDVVRNVAEKTGQYYVNHRWLGGMLTNWKTVSNSIKRLKELEKVSEQDIENLTKKEVLSLERERDKLSRTLGGIKDMGGVPDLLVVFDTNREALAVCEANVLKIPVVAVIDSNSDPDGIDYPIPGNDDALKALTLYCDLAMVAVLDGLAQSFNDAGGDAGESEVLEESVLAKEDIASVQQAQDDKSVPTELKDAMVEEEKQEVATGKEKKPIDSQEKEEGAGEQKVEQGAAVQKESVTQVSTAGNMGETAEEPSSASTSDHTSVQGGAGVVSTPSS